MSLGDLKNISRDMKNTSEAINKLLSSLEQFDNTIKHLILSIDTNTKALGHEPPDHGEV